MAGEDESRTSWPVRRPVPVLVLTALLCVLCAGVAAGLGDRLAAGGYAATGTRAERDEAAAAPYGADRAELALLVRPSASGPEPARAATAPAAARDGERLARQLAAEQGVDSVRTYWSGRDPALLAKDGRSALVLARLHGDDNDSAHTAERLVPRYTGQQGAVTVRATGPAWITADASRQAREDLLRAELIAGPLTFVLLALAFRSAVAAALPVLLGGISVLGAAALLRPLTELTDVSVFAVNLIGALGFGLAVDYALFLVSRFREESARGLPPPLAVRRSLRTAGRTVAVSACIVTAALAALLLFPFPFLRSMAYAGMLVVTLSAVAALTVLPACLVLLGDRVGRLDPLARLRWAPRPTVGGDSPLWRRTAEAVTRRPVPYGLGCALLLAAMVMPFGHVQLGLPDAKILPATSQAHSVADAVDRDFAASPDGTLSVTLPETGPVRAAAARGDVARGDAADGAAARGDLAAVDGYARRLAALPDVSGVRAATGTYRDGRRVAPAAGSGADSRGGADSRAGAGSSGRSGVSSAGRSGRGTVLAVTTRADPQSPEAAGLVRHVRETDAPGPAHIVGRAAEVADSRDALTGRLPWAAGLAAAGTAVLVFLFTRSVLVPLKVVAVGALSLAAAFGAVVHIFQDGNLYALVGDFTASGRLDMTIPILLFCVAFGLAVDYELFLVSRIQEAYRETGDNTYAVVHGIARTGRLFTAAALAVAVAMGALATSRVLMLKELGVGLALAVLVDATLVRGLLVPAVMRLAGRANWWCPGGRSGRVESPSSANLPAQSGTPERAEARTD